MDPGMRVPNMDENRDAVSIPGTIVFFVLLGLLAASSASSFVTTCIGLESPTMRTNAVQSAKENDFDSSENCPVRIPMPFLGTVPLMIMSALHVVVGRLFLLFDSTLLPVEQLSTEEA